MMGGAETSGPYRWALYDGSRMVAQGTGADRGACASHALTALYADVEAQWGDRFQYGLSVVRDALMAGYRWSCWGPRGGNLVHQQRFVGAKRRRRAR